MFGRIRGALGAVRPRVLAQLRKSVADLQQQERAHRAALKRLQDATASSRDALQSTLTAVRTEIQALAARHADFAAETQRTLATLRQDVDALALREAQLRAVAHADLDLSDTLPELEALLAEPATVQTHVRNAIGRATLHELPFPYMVVDDVLPEPIYRALLTGIPPAVLFADKRVNHQQLKPPFRFAPAYSRRIWTFMSDIVAQDIVRPLLLDRFWGHSTQWLWQNFPALEGTPLDGLRLACSDGRLLLRRRGYRIQPHRDPKWAMIT